PALAGVFAFWGSGDPWEGRAPARPGLGGIGEGRSSSWCSTFPGGLVSRWIFTLLQGWHWVPRLASMMALSASSVMPSWLKSYQLEAPPPWLGSAQWAHSSRSV